MSTRHLAEPGLTTKLLHAEGKSQEENRICSEYIERERNFQNESIKTIERSRVLDFLHEHDPAEDQHRCLLSLPCIHWSFEHKFRERMPKCRFVGLEWTWGVIELGRPFMPKKAPDGNVRPWGKPRYHIDRSFAIGEIVVIKTDIARWVWCHAGSFLSLRRSECADEITRRNFGHNYRSNTHVWLDFTSQLCAETKAALVGLGSFLHLGVSHVPVCVTVMAARDEHSSHESRVVEIYAKLNQRGHRHFELSKWWTYTHNGIPMMTVCGLMHKGDLLSPEQIAVARQKSLEDLREIST